jgi:hypothetical protein
MRQQPMAKGGRNRDRESSRIAVGLTREQIAHAVKVIEHLAAALEKDLSAARQGDEFIRSDEQFAFKFAFQSSDLLADRGLRHLELARRASEAARLRHCPKSSQ